MEQKHRKILEELNEMLQDIDVDNDIVEFLEDNGILTSGDIAKIKRETTRIEKATVLLEILPHRGSRAFDAFYQAIRKHYPWLSEQMLEMTSNGEDSRPPTSPILPIIPELTVNRAEKVQLLENALRALSPGHYVVLHGMKGYGRSRLTASTLTEALRAELFNNKIHWIKFRSEGINSVEDEILNQLQQLYDTIENRDVSLNIGKMQAEMQSMLTRHFRTLSHRESLLILDDAYDQRIINAFNFDCKTLIITTDTEILPSGITRLAKIIKMTEGFTEAESLELFARALGTQAESLPCEAKKFHHLCKGMPIMIDMFAARFAEYKEDMKNNGKRWRHYLTLVQKQDSTNIVMQDFLRYQSNTFDFCINRLDENQRTHYESLAIFSEDVNIMSETLGVYWDMDPCDADEIMTSLHKKSLIVKYWNADLNSTIYGVHDLLLSHLRNRIKNKDPQKLRVMHEDFVNKYYNRCGRDDHSKFPQDNYSHAYIGHHLEQANMIKYFQDLYLNFSFIQAKICYSGVNDLLIDLKKYRDHITRRNNEIERKVVDLEEFLRVQAKTLAEHRQRDCLDLVQIALNHHTRGYCYETARSIAKSQKTKLYLKNSHQHTVMHNPTAEDIKVEFSTLNYTDNPNKILVGTKTGSIMLWDCEIKKWTLFRGLEGSEIAKLIVSQNGEFFVALNRAPIVKYFTLDNVYEDDENYNCRNNHSHTPLDKQTFWSPIIQQQGDNSSITYKTNGEVITDIALSSDDKRLAACTTKGTVTVWDVNGKEMTSLNEPNTSFQKLTFAKVTQQLHVMDTKGTNFVYVWRDNNYVYNTRYLQLRKDSKEPSKDEVIIYFKEKVYVSVDREGEFETVLICLTRQNLYIISWGIGENGDLYAPRKRHIYTAENSQFTVAKETYDGKYLIIGDTENLLSVMGLDDGFEPIVKYPERTLALDTYYDYECQCHLIISGDKHSIQHRTFYPENVPQSVLRPLFDAVMKPLGKSNIVAQEIVGNKIGFFGDNLKVETDVLHGQIISLSLSPEGKKILYTLKRKKKINEEEIIEYTIYQFNIENNETSEILTSLKEFPSFVKFIKFHDKLAIVCKQNNHLCYILEKNNEQFDENNKKYEKIWIRTGSIVNLHTINNKYVVGVTRDEQVKIWKMNTSAWDCICQIGDTGRNLHEMQRSHVLHSAINLENTMLATVTSDYRLVIYEIGYKSGKPGELRKLDNTCFKFFKKLTCCAFSPDDEVLAIGMEDGSITIFHLKTRKAYPKELTLHQNSILQLHWAPSEVGAPILLSINCDELAWWNVALMEDNSKKKKKYGRTGIIKSSTVPLLDFKSLKNSQMRNSQTADANLSVASTSRIDDNINNNNISNGNNEINGNDARDNEESREEMPKYWTLKTYKNENRRSLLGVIRLPPNCRAKVCVSSDFYKFLLVDVHGSIKCFEIIEVASEG